MGVKAMTDMGYVEAYNRSCSDFEGKCYEADWEFNRVGIRPLHYGVLPWGKECWVLGSKALRDACCGDPRSWYQGCWTKRLRKGPCCDRRLPSPWPPAEEEL